MVPEAPTAGPEGLNHFAIRATSVTGWLRTGGGGIRVNDRAEIARWFACFRAGCLDEPSYKMGQRHMLPAVALLVEAILDPIAVVAVVTSAVYWWREVRSGFASCVRA